MSVGELPDFGKIGKRIGKRLRDVLSPPADHGPSKEARLARRLRDSLKGLVYFDNFDEINDWRVGEVDPVQQANTPLLERPASQVYDQKGPSSRLLLCHDYSGGYHDWEGVRPLTIKEKPYSCNYFQYVETFVYFSHKAVCVPPASWINVCHRNGVKVLGTFIMEGDGEKKSIQRMFDQVDGEYVVPKRLASMAKAYGFDGWLLNIEAEYPYDVQHPITHLAAFVRSLKRFLGSRGTVVWYDAITKDNEVDYQNSLTWKNVEFALAADVLFTNYKWTERELHKSQAVAEQHGIRLAEIYFGIDVWAQNTNMPGPPRVTYPPNGGGGTLTGLATNVLAHNGFSTAIFGPGWTHEHFSSSTKPRRSSETELEASKSDSTSSSVLKGTVPRAPESVAEAVELAMWEGDRLPDELGCNCKRGHPHHRHGYQHTPIVNAARQYPVGSSTFFETDFRQAFSPALNEGNDTSNVKISEADLSWITELGSQAIFPHLSQNGDLSEPVLHGELRNGSNPYLRVGLNSSITADLLSSDKTYYDLPKMSRLCLFKSHIATDVDLVALICFQQLSSDTANLTIGFYARSVLPDSEQLEDTEYGLPWEGNRELQHFALDLHHTTLGARIVEFGVYCMSKFHVGRSEAVFDLFRLAIGPKRMMHVEHTYTIEHIRVYQRQAGATSETRLTWTWKGPQDKWPAGVPWSNTTGPFSHFTIVSGHADNPVLGRAHCLEFPLRQDDFLEGTADAVWFTVKGHLFGSGRVVSSATAELPRTDFFVS